MPREQRLKTVALKRGRRATDGQIVYLPASRTVMGMGDYVYVDRGELHGLEVGSELEIFDGGRNVADPVRRSTVHTPDEVGAVGSFFAASRKGHHKVVTVGADRRDLLLPITQRIVAIDLDVIVGATHNGGECALVDTVVLGALRTPTR